MSRKHRFFIFLSLVTIGFLFLGTGIISANGEPQGKGPSSLKEARKDLEKKLAGSPGFAGIAHSEDEGTIVVFLEDEQSKGKVPDSFNGFPVRKEVTGKFKALGTQVLETPAAKVANPVADKRTDMVRPLVGGISVSALAGTYYVYAGTLGMVTYDNKIISNAHVMAMNPDNDNWLQIGTPIIQPGTLDLWNSGKLDQAVNYKVGALLVPCNTYSFG